jgi:hypothetical protein
VVDPFGKIKQLRLPRNAFSQVHTVGPPVAHLPPAGVVSTPNTGLFPNPPTGQLIGVQSTTTPISAQTPTAGLV